VLIGPPGSKRKELALTLADHLTDEGLTTTCISVGDLINKEVTKHSDFGIEIEQSRETYSYVKDEIVI
jgi:adenylate kinase